MKTKTQLINNIIGQLYGIGRMMKDEKNCFQTINQMKAARSALTSLMNKYIEDNFTECIDSCKSNPKKVMIKKLILELTKK